MNKWMRTLRAEAGMSLVEAMAALLVFAVITIGIVPLMAGSLRGVNTSRSLTVGKNLVQEAMERVRGLPYFISYASKATRVDILDLYFPDITSAGFNSTNNSFTTTCTSATVSRSCPAGLPSGYTLTYKAEFVKPGAVVNGMETYVVEPPPTGYTWQADPATNPSKDLPPTQLVRMAITGSWSVGGTTRSFDLTSLLGEREITDDKVRGAARVNYAVEVLTTFTHTTDGTIGDLIAIAGASESRIETRVLSDAEQVVRAGDLKLTRLATATQPSTVIDSFIGAEAILGTPPDQTSSGASKTGELITHEDANIGDVAFLDDSTTSGLRVAVANELPIATGSFSISSEGTSDLDRGFWVDNQALVGSDPTTSPLLLSPTRPVLGIVKNPSLTTTAPSIEGSTSAVTGNVVSDRRVQATAQVKFGRARLFPVTFISDDGGLIRIEDFDAKTDCKTTGSTAGFATPQYSAKLSFFKETAINDGLTAGAYQAAGSEIALAGTNTSDPLDTYFKPTGVITGDVTAHPNGSNPMVWEAPADVDPNGSALDLYLFPVTHHHVVDNTDPQNPICVVCHNHRGYLESWDSEHSVAGTLGAGGTTSAASIRGAITINTAPSNPDKAETALAISLGSVSCEAVDRR